MKKLLAGFLALLFSWTLSCQSMQYGSPLSSRTLFGGAADKEFETTGDDEQGKVDTWVYVLIATAVGVGTAVVVPLVVTDQL